MLFPTLTSLTQWWGKVGEQGDPVGTVGRKEEMNSGLERGLDETVSWYGKP